VVGQEDPKRMMQQPARPRFKDLVQFLMVQTTLANRQRKKGVLEAHPLEEKSMVPIAIAERSDLTRDSALALRGGLRTDAWSAMRVLRMYQASVMYDML
jgi:hypothetical protein